MVAETRHFRYGNKNVVHSYYPQAREQTPIDARLKCNCNFCVYLAFQLLAPNSKLLY